MSDFLATKPIDLLLAEARDESESGLRRVLGPVNLVTLGIGAIIGAGIFVLTGTVAASFTGPAIVLSFILAGSGCIFAGLCYAEFASLIPIAGSAYTYGYATLGEIFAWIIGWDLIIEYAFGAASVAVGWSGNLVALFQSFGIQLPPQITAPPGTLLVLYNGQWSRLATIGTQLASAGVDATKLPSAHGILDLPAYLVIALMTLILVIGVRESANFNSLIVFIKVGTVLTFIAIATAYLLRHPQVAAANWHPFIPPNQGSFGAFGWSGIARGAGVIFFAYIGFDAVSTAAQEARNPQRDMPIGILGSLAICTVLYVCLGSALTGVVNYTALNTAAPVAVGIQATGVRWGSIVVMLGTFAGLTTTMLVMLLGQSRVFFSMSRDGLLPEWAGRVHPRFRTPWISSIVVGFFVAILAGVLPISVLSQLTSIGTLLAFVIVSAGVWALRIKRPDLPRPFKAPLIWKWVPLTPILGILISLGLMASLPGSTWLRLIVWLIVGMAIYFGYGRSHSKLRKRAG
ncbi:MAG: amino acid permease [Acidobacteriia bacterium]|nr:amino acid permease [Terriglobia bacterium]